MYVRFRKRCKTIKGSDKNGGVSDIHSNLKTGDYSVSTPIKTLESAYDGLLSKDYSDYEQWLVVLTDGAFTVSDSSSQKVNESEVEIRFRLTAAAFPAGLYTFPSAAAQMILTALRLKR